MAFVNHDVAEIVLRVEGGKKVGRAFLSVNVERLIGGHVNSGIAGVVAAVRVAADLGGVGSEYVLKGTHGLGSKLVAVANEERPLELASVGDSPEKLDRYERLAGARGER